MQTAVVLCADHTFFGMQCHIQGRKPPVFLPCPLFPGFPVPHRSHWVYPVELSRLRSRGDCRRHSFRSLAAYCSPSAHPRNFCCSAFALSGQKFIRMRAARSAATASHPWRKVATVVIHRKYPIRLIRLIRLRHPYQEIPSAEVICEWNFCQAFFKKASIKPQRSEGRDTKQPA